jgi:predicted HTH domain antitoxin
MSTIQITVDESMGQLLGESTGQIERSAREIIVLDLFRCHVVSAGRAAEVLDLDLLSFIRWSGARGVPYFDLSDDDLEQERRAIESM